MKRELASLVIIAGMLSGCVAPVKKSGPADLTGKFDAIWLAEISNKIATQESNQYIYTCSTGKWNELVNINNGRVYVNDPNMPSGTVDSQGVLYVKRSTNRGFTNEFHQTNSQGTIFLSGNLTEKDGTGHFIKSHRGTNGCLYNVAYKRLNNRMFMREKGYLTHSIELFDENGTNTERKLVSTRFENGYSGLLMLKSDHDEPCYGTWKQVKDEPKSTEDKNRDSRFIWWKAMCLGTGYYQGMIGWDPAASKWVSLILNESKTRFVTRH